MKTIKIILPALLVLITAFASRADILFQDQLNYPNSLIETDGFWFGYSPSPPKTNVFVISHLLTIAQGTGEDSVAAPGGPSFPVGFTNNIGTLTIASFTINVTKLPTASDYFAALLQVTNGTTDAADVAHVFCTTSGTQVPGSYHLGLANYATSFSTFGTTNYPLDMATDVTYQVVVSYDTSLQGAYLWINPSSDTDNGAFAVDNSSSTAQQNINISGIGFSPYITVARIGDIAVGTQFSDVDSGVPTNPPIIGIQPHNSTNLYSGDNLQLFVAASAIDPTYQWYSNKVALVDDGMTIVGSQNNILSLTNLQIASNTFYCVVSDGDGNTTSAVATVSIDTTPTLPFFTSVPQNSTNVTTSRNTLSVAANGTGPITYQWYFSVAGSDVTNPISGATGTSYSYTATTNATLGGPGYYYVEASNSVGNSNSSVFSVTVVPPVLVSIAYMHQFITNDAALDNVAGGQTFYIQGVVTTIGNILYSSVSSNPSYALYYIQDGTGGCAIFTENTSTNNPPAGSLVSVVTPAESYYGELEMDPYAGGSVTIVSNNFPLPAPQLFNMAEFVTNTFDAYASNVQCAVVSLTNVYLSTSGTTYTPPAANFPTNATVELYAWSGTNSAPGQTNLIVYVYTYTNVLNQINTNYWGQPIPSYCYQLTGVIGLYNPDEPELYPSRYQDFVSSLPPSFSVTNSVAGGTTALSWPAVPGSTYSLYSATNLLGPWTQTFGLAYYPSIGSFTDTNTARAKFYKVSSP
jgi:hypothetical protein